MTIELPLEIENQLKKTAREHGVSVGQYVEKLVADTSLRQTQLSAFRVAVQERMASMNTGAVVDGEEVMARLIAELASQ